MTDDHTGSTTPNSGVAIESGGLAQTREALAQAAKSSIDGGRFDSWHPLADLFAVFCFVMAMIMLLIQPDSGMVPRPSVDTVAQDTIRSGRDVLVEDRSATKTRQYKAKAAVLEIFDFELLISSII